MSKLEGDFTFTDTVTFARPPGLPPGTISNAAVASNAAIAATKLVHQHAIHYQQADGSAIVAAIVPIHTVRGITAEIIDVEVVCVDSPSGGDLKFTVDLLKADAGTPTPASVLSAVIDYVNATPDCTVLAGTITDEDLVDGDTLLVQVAVSGSTGTQGQGLIVTVTLREDAE